MEPSFDLDSLQDYVDDLRVQQERMKQERKELEAMKATIEKNLKKFKGRVKLNVGGDKFETTLSTLTAQPDSMLAAMFSGRHKVPQDEDGYVFIDRDGTHFRVILNFLRTGFLNVPPSHKESEELRCELEFYQLSTKDLDSSEVGNEPPMVEVVTTHRSSYSGNEKHAATIQQKISANPKLRIASNHITGSEMVTILGTKRTFDHIT